MICLTAWLLGLEHTSKRKRSGRPPAFRCHHLDGLCHLDGRRLHGRFHHFDGLLQRAVAIWFGSGLPRTLESVIDVWRTLWEQPSSVESSKGDASLLPNPSLLFRLEDHLARSKRRRRPACGQRPSEVAIGSMLPAAFESLVHGHSRPSGPLVVSSVFWFMSTPSVPVAALYLARQQCQCFTSGNVLCLLSRLSVCVGAIHCVGSASSLFLA